VNETAAERDVLAAAICRELRGLFVVTGELSAAGVEPRAAIALSALSGRLARLAESVYELLPVRVGIEREALVDAVDPRGDAAVGELAALAAARDARGACAVLARVVLPRLGAVAASAASGVDVRLDAPRARVLEGVRRELEEAAATLEATTRALSALGPYAVSDAASCAASAAAIDAAGPSAGRGG